MNILLANYRYFVSGGPERYLFNVMDKLETSGHHVVPFSVSHPDNVPSPYDHHFLSPLSKGGAVYFRELKKNPKVVAKLLGRLFYSFEARQKLSHLLSRETIDVAYLLHFLRWISPSILDEFRARNIPVVIRVSDYSYLCPQSHFLRDGDICEHCLEGSFWPSVQNRCLHGSLGVSFLNALSLSFHRHAGMWDKIDAVLCPSRFMLEKMVEGGVPHHKLFHVPTFVDSAKFTPQYEPGDYFLYFGRIAYEKGISVLVEAFRRLAAHQENRGGCRLKIVGRSNDGERERLERMIIAQGIKGVTFHDEQDLSTLHETIRKALCVIVPSVWYDNMPNVVLESYACGKPVIASNLGSLPEIVVEGKTGFLFPPGDPDHLASLLRAIAENPALACEMGRRAREDAETIYSPAAHIRRLVGIFNKLATKE